MKLTFNTFIGLFAFLSLQSQTFAQGTTTLTFEGPPYLHSGSAIHVQSYSEAGFWFMPIPGTDGFVRQGGGISFYPENGTTYLQATLGDSLMFATDDRSTFSLVSVDLAGYSTVVPQVTAYFVGYRPDGSTVNTSFPASGVTFQTYYFDPEFSGLTRVEMPDFGSLDNLVLSVPEPGTGALLFLAGGVFALRLIREKKT